jgi:hypothetical protein
MFFGEYAFRTIRFQENTMTHSHTSHIRLLVLGLLLALAAAPQYSHATGAAGSMLASRAVYPNPFTTSTTFQLTMPRTTQIRIAVFDLLGKPVRVLFEGLHQQGQYDIPWDGNDTAGNPVPPGIYICVLFSEGIAVKPVKVIKIAQ